MIVCDICGDPVKDSFSVTIVNDNDMVVEEIRHVCGKCKEVIQRITEDPEGLQNTSKKEDYKDMSWRAVLILERILQRKKEPSEMS